MGIMAMYLLKVLALSAFKTHLELMKPTETKDVIP